MMNFLSLKVGTLRGEGQDNSHTLQGIDAAQVKIEKVFMF